MNNLVYEININNQKYEIPRIVAEALGKEKFMSLNNNIDGKTRYLILLRLNMIYSNYVQFANEHIEFQENDYRIINYVTKARKQVSEMHNYDLANSLLYQSIEELIKIIQNNEMAHVKVK